MHRTGVRRCSLEHTVRHGHWIRRRCSAAAPAGVFRRSATMHPVGSMLRFWTSASWIALLLFAGGKAQATDLDNLLWTARWNHDGSQFAVGGVHTLRIFDSDTLESRSLLPKALDVRLGGTNIPYVAVTRLAWHPTSNLLAVSSQGKNVGGIYDVSSSQRTDLSATEEHFGRGVSWRPDGRRLAYTSDDRLVISKDDGTLLHDIPRYKEAKGLTGVAWSPLGDRIVTIGARITLHDAQGNPIRQRMHRPEAQERLQLLLCVAWHPSGDFFVVGDYGTDRDDPVLQFWSAEGELIKSITLKGDTQIRNVSWKRDGSRLASASSKLGIWKRDGELEFEAKSPDLLWGVDWHPNGEKVLTSSIAGRVTLWSANALVEKQVGVPPRSEPRADGAANGNLPIRAGTNSTSSAAGSPH